jgi:hypothetical protein
MRTIHHIACAGACDVYRAEMPSCWDAEMGHMPESVRGNDIDGAHCNMACRAMMAPSSILFLISFLAWLALFHLKL